MRILLAEDDFASRKFMSNYLAQYGECDAASDGEEAVEAFSMAIEDGEPYDLLCLDVMMPVMDGYQVLQTVRDIEAENKVPKEKRAKVVMTTALNDDTQAHREYDAECEAYSGKPLDIEKFEKILRNFGLL